MYDKEIGVYYLIAGYYNPEHGVFLSVDPAGYAAWLAINAVVAGYNAYNAYKSGKGWKGVAVAAGAGLVGGVTFKGVKIAYNAYMLFEARGTKKQMHQWQHQKILAYKKKNNGKRPPLNKSDY